MSAWILDRPRRRELSGQEGQTDMGRRTRRHQTGLKADGKGYRNELVLVDGGLPAHGVNVNVGTNGNQRGELPCISASHGAADPDVDLLVAIVGVEAETGR